MDTWSSAALVHNLPWLAGPRRLARLRPTSSWSDIGTARCIGDVCSHTCPIQLSDPSLKKPLGEPATENAAQWEED
jgi:hypothetical protein